MSTGSSCVTEKKPISRPRSNVDLHINIEPFIIIIIIIISIIIIIYFQIVFTLLTFWCFYILLLVVVFNSHRSTILFRTQEACT